MKYIRTKNGIYDTDTMSVSQLYDGDIFLGNVSYSKQINDNTFICIDEKDVIAKADTIKELCDEFVYTNYFFNQNKPMLYPNDWDIKEMLTKDARVIVYGAIWTDKGLIYVAKMNNKGELELL